MHKLHFLMTTKKGKKLTFLPSNNSEIDSVGAKNEICFILSNESSKFFCYCAFICKERRSLKSRLF